MRLPVLITALLALPLQAAPPVPTDGTGTFLGVETCGSSQCHDSPEPWRNATVLMQERRIWEQHDPHARASDSLRSAQGKRIAKSLGLGPAVAAKACLACHGTSVPKPQQGPRFQADRGVICEACHGAGGNFLPTHVQPTSTHAGNLAAGMYPTTDPQARAALCTSCHVGDGPRQVTHAMYAAGHPRLRFENDTYYGLLPAHARIDADYLRRKPTVSHTQAWAAGQIASARRLIHRLEALPQGHGLFPELSLFDCQGCHRPLAPPTADRSSAPGIPALADGPLWLLRAWTLRVAPDMAPELVQLTPRLQAALRDRQTLPSALASARSVLDRLESRGRAHVELADDALCISQTLSSLPGSGAAPSQGTAETLAMSLSSLLLAQREAQQMDEPAYQALDGRLDALYRSLRDEHGYRAALFLEQLQALHGQLRGLGRCDTAS